MNRKHVTWSNFVDEVEGPCVVCGEPVQYVIPSDRPDPSLLYHSTCDPIQKIREKLKTLQTPPLPPEYIVRGK